MRQGKHQYFVCVLNLVLLVCCFPLVNCSLQTASCRRDRVMILFMRFIYVYVCFLMSAISNECYFNVCIFRFAILCLCFDVGILMLVTLYHVLNFVCISSSGGFPRGLARVLAMFGEVFRVVYREFDSPHLAACLPRLLACLFRFNAYYM